MVLWSQIRSPRCFRSVVGAHTGARPCRRPVAGIWTCTTGEQTILHSTAYDICDECYREQVRAPHV